MCYALFMTFAVTSISSFMLSSSKPATNMVAAGRVAPRYFLKIGQHVSKSVLSGNM